MPSVPRLLASLALFLCLSAQSHLAPEQQSNQLMAELNRLNALEYSWADRQVQPTDADVQKFITEVRSAKTRFPGALAHPEIDRVHNHLLKRVAFYETEAEYRDAHPQQAAAAKALKQKTDGLKAGQPAPTKEGLDRFFDNSSPGGQSAAVAGAPGTKTAPATTPSAKRPIDGKGPPPPFKWKFEPSSTEGLPQDELDWRKSIDAEEKEKAFLTMVLAGFDVPVERELLATVAREQALTAAEMKRRETRAAAGVASVEARLRGPNLSAADTKHLKEQLALYKKNLAAIQQFSSELVMTMGELPEGVGAASYIDSKPGPDGKQHVRVVFNRLLAFNVDPVGNNAKDAARKVTAHELSHVGDFYALARDEGPSERFLEPRAFRNAALSYKQEGLPKGLLVERWGGQDYRWLRSDPVGWMHRQTIDYASEGTIAGPKSIWNEYTADDYAAPDHALSWRLQYAYRYATVLGKAAAHESRERRLRRIGKEFNLDPKAIEDLLALDADKATPDAKKPALFAARAAKLESSREWVRSLAAADKNVVAKARREEAEFFRSLAPLYP